jgi:hypothetical protein
MSKEEISELEKRCRVNAIKKHESLGMVTAIIPCIIHGETLLQDAAIADRQTSKDMEAVE